MLAYSAGRVPNTVQTSIFLILPTLASAFFFFLTVPVCLISSKSTFLSVLFASLNIFSDLFKWFTLHIFGLLFKAKKESRWVFFQQAKIRILSVICMEDSSWKTEKITLVCFVVISHCKLIFRREHWLNYKTVDLDFMSSKNCFAVRVS